MLGIIIQARTGSTRLPRKMLLPFHKGKSILELLIDRIQLADLHVPIILATTTNNIDNELISIVENKGIYIFRGSENDVLSRFISAAQEYSIDKIIRICADNPFLDIIDLNKQIQDFRNSSYDYWCYSLESGTPSIITHYGFWGEGVTLSALKIIAESTNDTKFHEHVTNFIYTNEKLFSLYKKQIPKGIERVKLRLTIDTIIDFEIASQIYSKMVERNFSITSMEVFKYVVSNQVWVNMMSEEIKSNKK
jgi:spore coat polysaccharide biosynthesis protein SpsF